MLLSACEQFLGKSEQEIQHIALVTLEGHQRAIMGSMTVEEIYKDRKMFSKKVSWIRRTLFCLSDISVHKKQTILPPHTLVVNLTDRIIHYVFSFYNFQVFEVASSDLINMGITVVSYTLKDIRDEEVSLTGA